MEPFARAIDAVKKYVVSSTLDRVDWNAELMRGIWGRLFSSSSESGKGQMPNGVVQRTRPSRHYCIQSLVGRGR
jgi:hypothetical protein